MKKLLTILMSWEPIFGYITNLNIIYNEPEQRYSVIIQIKYKTEYKGIAISIDETRLLQKLSVLQLWIHESLNNVLKETI